MTDYQYDAFICHASEDKVDVVEPLATELVQRGLDIWYDAMTLKIGDSLRRKIDEGLAKSRFGLVVLSPDFFNKEWTQYELDGLLAREMADAAKVILPIWHNVGAKEVRSYSYPLSIRLAGNTNKGINHLADELSEVLGKLRVPLQAIAVQDDLALAKQVVLTSALERGSNIHLIPPTSGSGKTFVSKTYAFNDTEKQRKLFLFALEQLERDGLVERLSDTYFELTYLGHQAAERMQPVENPEKLGVDSSHF